MNEHRQESTVWAADLLGLFARSLRRLWWLCLVLIVLCTALFGGYARLSYRAQYTASITFLVNAGGTAQSGTGTATAAQMAKTFPYILTSGLLDSAVCADTGLTALQKFVLQLAAAVAFLCLMRYEGMLSPNLYIPFFNTYVVLNWVVYMILAAFIIVGTVNAVNITDGLDGLSTSVTIPVAAFFAVLGVVWKGFPQLGVFGGAMAGGLLAFLLYNHYPAKVFMGDTGSLFLGGAVAALAFAYDMPLVLIPVGIVYICETLSDILQVGYFKLTHGKRIFKMAPLHHHFEMCGWKETKIVAVFTTVSVIFCALAYLGVMNRFAY